MRDLLTTFESNWTEFCDRRSGAAPGVRLEDLPPLPLARTARMPEGHPYESGALSLRLSDLIVTGAHRLDIGRCSIRREGREASISLGLGPLEIVGRHAVMSKPDPVVAIDAAGNLMDLAPDQRAPVAAGAAPGDPPLDPQKEAWLNNARDQRAKLAQTPNGQLLLGTYTEHNETFAEVMSNASVATNWQAGGATKEMAGDTHVAVKSDSVVNSASKTYSGNVTYNGNAFAQQLQVALGCILLDPTSDFGAKQPAANSRYWAASKASLAFGKGVSTSTGNTKDKVTEMRGSHVYHAVDNHTGPAPAVSDAEAWQVLNSDDSGGGRDAGQEEGWIVLDEEDRARLARLKAAMLSDLAAQAKIVGAPLFEGGCGARIDDARLVVNLGLDGTEGVESSAAEVYLPPFEFDIDDSGWVGDAGAIARQRVANMQFIRALLRETVLRGLRELALAVGPEAFTAAARETRCE